MTNEERDFIDSLMMSDLTDESWKNALSDIVKLQTAKVFLDSLSLAGLSAESWTKTRNDVDELLKTKTFIDSLKTAGFSKTAWEQVYAAALAAGAEYKEEDEDEDDIIVLEDGTVIPTGFIGKTYLARGTVTVGHFIVTDAVFTVVADDIITVEGVKFVVIPDEGAGIFSASFTKPQENDYKVLFSLNKCSVVYRSAAAAAVNDTVNCCTETDVDITVKSDYTLVLQNGTVVSMISGFSKIGAPVSKGYFIYDDPYEGPTGIGYSSETTVDIKVTYGENGKPTFTAGEGTTIVMPWYNEVNLNDQIYDGPLKPVDKITVTDKGKIGRLVVETDVPVTFVYDNPRTVKVNSIRLPIDYDIKIVISNNVFTVVVNKANVMIPDVGTIKLDITNSIVWLDINTAVYSKNNIVVDIVNSKLTGTLNSFTGLLTGSFNNLTVNGEVQNLSGVNQFAAEEGVNLYDFSHDIVLLKSNLFLDILKDYGYNPATMTYFWEDIIEQEQKAAAVVTTPLGDEEVTGISDLGMPLRVFRAYFRALAAQNGELACSLADKHNAGLTAVAAQKTFVDYVKRFQRLVRSVHKNYISDKIDSTPAERAAQINDALKALCNIDLSNEDSGSIIGLDAGGVLSKKLDDIVVDSDTAVSSVYPTKIYKVIEGTRYVTVKGIKLVFPQPDSLFDKQKKIICELAEWYYPAVFNALEAVFGQPFGFAAKNFSGVIKTVFEASEDDIITVKWETDETLKKNKGFVKIILNSTKFEDINSLSGKVDNIPVDISLLRAMVLAMWYVNLPYDVKDYGNWFVKGGTEFSSSGIDKTRTIGLDWSINTCFVSFLTEQHDVELNDSYIWGTIFMRWLFNTLAEERGWRLPDSSNDTQSGGGSDTPQGGGTDTPTGGGGSTDTQQGGGSSDTPQGGSGSDTPSGGGGSSTDTPQGGGTSDTESGGGSTDTPQGGGTDTPSGGGTDTPQGGGGSDTPQGGGGSTDTTQGGSTDTPQGGNTDTPQGGSSTDTSSSGGSTDTPQGGGTDTTQGGSTDTPTGGGGGSTDTPQGGNTDTPQGGGTSDTGSGGGSTDTPQGGGQDTATGGGSDTPQGGGTDTPQGGGTDTGGGGGSTDTPQGGGQGSGTDTGTGGGTTDTPSGGNTDTPQGGSSDTPTGSGSTDTPQGSGTDTPSGGGGNTDTPTGGGTTDTPSGGGSGTPQGGGSDTPQGGEGTTDTGQGGGSGTTDTGSGGSSGTTDTAQGGSGSSTPQGGGTTDTETGSGGSTDTPQGGGTVDTGSGGGSSDTPQGGSTETGSGGSGSGTDTPQGGSSGSETTDPDAVIVSANGQTVDLNTVKTILVSATDVTAFNLTGTFTGEHKIKLFTGTVNNIVTGYGATVQGNGLKISGTYDITISGGNFETAEWSAVNNNMAVYTSVKKSVNISGDAVVLDITITETADLTGIKSTADITVSNKVVTLTETALNKQNVTISGNGYTLALDKSYAAVTTDACFDGFVYKSASSTESYTISNDAKTITYTAAVPVTNLFTLTGLKNTAGITVNNKTVTLTASNLNEQDVTISDNSYTLALGSDITGSSVTEPSWSINGQTAVYKSGSVIAGYNLTGNKVVYVPATESMTLVTVTGVRTTSGLSLTGTVVTVSAASLNQTDVTVSDGYTLALGSDVDINSYTLIDNVIVYHDITTANLTDGQSLDGDITRYTKVMISGTATVKDAVISTDKPTVFTVKDENNLALGDTTIPVNAGITFTRTGDSNKVTASQKCVKFNIAGLKNTDVEFNNVIFLSPDLDIIYAPVKTDITVNSAGALTIPSFKGYLQRKKLTMTVNGSSYTTTSLKSVGTGVTYAEKPATFLPTVSKTYDVLKDYYYDCVTGRFSFEHETISESDIAVSLISNPKTLEGSTSLGMPLRVFRAYFNGLADTEKEPATIREAHSAGLEAIGAKENDFAYYVKQYYLTVKYLYNKYYGWKKTYTPEDDIEKTALDRLSNSDLYKELANIDLLNKDTGMISGFDASGGTEKQGAEIVPDPASTLSTSYPTTVCSYDSSRRQVTVDGITYVVPDPTNLADWQKRVICELSYWYFKELQSALTSVFGFKMFSRNHPDYHQNLIDIIFSSLSDADIGAQVTTPGVTVNGSQKKIVRVTINTNHSDWASSTNMSGAFSINRYLFYDNAILHEFVHAYQKLHLPYDSKLTGSWFVEGGAELASKGGDLDRIDVTSDFDAPLFSVFTYTLTSTYSPSSDKNYPYAYGYIFLRWFFKRLAEERGWKHPVTELKNSDKVTSNYAQKYYRVKGTATIGHWTVTSPTGTNGSTYSLDVYFPTENTIRFGSGVSYTIANASTGSYNISIGASFEQLLVFNSNTQTYIRYSESWIPGYAAYIYRGAVITSMTNCKLMLPGESSSNFWFAHKGYMCCLAYYGNNYNTAYIDDNFDIWCSNGFVLSGINVKNDIIVKYIHTLDTAGMVEYNGKYQTYTQQTSYERYNAGGV